MFTRPVARVSDQDEPLVLITGGAKRVGRALALDFIENGWRVAAQYWRSEDEAQSLMRQSRGKTQIFKCDLRDIAAAKDLLSSVQNAMGPIDGLINNAALFEYDSAEDFDLDVFFRMAAMNLVQAIVLSQMAVQIYRKQVFIINILDQKIRNRSTKNFSYTLSKIGLAAAAEALSKTGVRINAVAPGIMLPSGPQSADEFAAMASDNPLRRPPLMVDLCAATRLLAETTCLRDQIIYVDGGLHLRGAPLIE
jgi:NAD(P)-dependent dehydrogenase (short-subunit alcohol dehydrogenase family)